MVRELESVGECDDALEQCRQVLVDASDRTRRLALKRADAILDRRLYLRRQEATRRRSTSTH